MSGTCRAGITFVIEDQRLRNRWKSFWPRRECCLHSTECHLSVWMSISNGTLGPKNFSANAKTDENFSANAKTDENWGNQWLQLVCEYWLVCCSMLNFHYLHKLWKTLASPHLGRGVGASQKSCKFPVWARRPGHLINPLWCNEQWACKRVAILTDIKHNIKQIINIRQKIIFRPFQAPTLAT